MSWCLGDIHIWCPKLGGYGLLINLKFFGPEIRRGAYKCQNFADVLYECHSLQILKSASLSQRPSTPHDANIIQQSRCHPSLLFHTHKCPSHPWSVHPDAEEINNSEMQWPGGARSETAFLPSESPSLSLLCCHFFRIFSSWRKS